MTTVLRMAGWNPGKFQNTHADASSRGHQSPQSPYCINRPRGRLTLHGPVMAFGSNEPKATACQRLNAKQTLTFILNALLSHTMGMQVRSLV